MHLRTKFILAMLVSTVVGLLLAPATPTGTAVWGGMPEGGPEPTGGQIGLMMVYTAFAAAAMGFGIAFWAFAYPWTQRVFPFLTVPAHIAIGFIPGTFWIHDSLHMINGENINGLLALEYVFHLPTILAGVVLALATIRSTGGRVPAYAAKA